MLSTIRKSIQQSFQIKRCLHRFTCEPLTEDRYEEALNHIRETTYRDISLYKAAGLVETGRALAELDNVYLKSMKDGISKIFLNEGKLAGIMINGILTPDAVSDAVANLKKATNERYKKIDYMFLMSLQELDIFARFGINRAIECLLVSISREYRGTGLLKIVVDNSLKTARDFDYPLIVAEVTNTSLWNSLALHDWILLRELQFSDYIDEATGKPLYKVDPPNNILHICARIVDNRCKSKDPLPLPNSKLYYPIKMD